MKSKTVVIILFILALLLSGWIGSLLKICPLESAPEYIYIQDTKAKDSLTAMVKTYKSDLDAREDTIKTLKGQLLSKRAKRKKVIEQVGPSEEIADVVSESDSACDAVIQAQEKQIQDAGDIIHYQDTLLLMSEKQHSKDSSDVVAVNLKLEKSKKKLKRKNTWIKGLGIAVLAFIIKEVATNSVK